MIIENLFKPTVVEGSAANDYFTRRKSEEERIAGTRTPVKNKKNPAETDYSKRRAQEKKVHQGVAEGESGMFSKVMGHETTPEAARQIQQQGFKKSHTGIFFNVGNQNYSGGGYGGTVVMAKVSGPIDDILNLEDDNDLPDNLDDFADGEEIANYAREEGYWAWTDGVQFAVLDPMHIQVVKQGVAEGLQNNGISFRVQKGKNKFVTTMTVNNEQVGVYQYDATTGRSIAEVYPEFKGKGFGKLLVLHAIYTAAKLGLDFQEDESRTAEYDNVLDSLSSNSYIVDDDGYWYVTGEGEQYLQQSLKQGVAEGADRAEAQADYMEGQCMILAVAINQYNPKRYPIGYIWEYNMSAGAPDMQLDDDEWNDLSPEEQEEISNDISRHSIVHAYVRDQETNEYIDARGRHKTLPNLWGRLGQTRFEEFPGSARELIDITAHGDWDEVGDQVNFKRGRPAFDSLAGPAGVKRALDYAVKYLGVEGSKNKATGTDQQGVAEATGDERFDSMMGQITGGAGARQGVDNLKW